MGARLSVGGLIRNEIYTIGSGIGETKMTNRRAALWGQQLAHILLFVLFTACFNTYLSDLFQSMVMATLFLILSVLESIDVRQEFVESK